MAHALAVPLMAEPTEAARDARDARWSGLMAAAQEGDQAAYAILLGECLPLLRAICRARLRDAAEVEDAVQDALLTLHRVRHTYDPARPFRPWLSAIAERRALDRVRRRGRRTARETTLDDAAEIGAEGDAEQRFAGGQLRAAVSELPPAQRTALQLTKLEQLSLQEASARSGMSVAALKVATHRAIATLRKRLSGGSS
ncbi:MAG: sigma-70 family RNA polymerase sigma factor [Rubritepida sp.]|jgi:RNA polymerase sigma-70 factor (ECF subfamily)|nr:sigma-70 family RNA polymerase sigma factor [Rubritepida sp.]MCU0943766.1 sigma-70 family RNA polymerase sigma factor [Rubritepida sp.]